MKNIQFLAIAVLLIATLFNANNISAQWSQSTTAIYPTSLTKNVGIGTSNPGARLHVMGGSIEVGPMDATVEGGEIQLDGAGANPAWIVDVAYDRYRVHTGGKEKFTVTSTGKTFVGDETDSGTSPSLGFGGFGSGEGLGSRRTAGGNQNGLDFYTNGLNRMSINSAGNIGIGTTAPTSAKLQFDNGAGNKITLYDHGNNVAYGFGINASNLCAYIPVGSRFSIRTNNSNGAEKFTVNSDGSFGGGSRIYPGMTATEGGYSLVHFKNGTSTTGGVIRTSIGNSDYGDAPLELQSSNLKIVTNTAVSMSVLGNGNIGIGTINPSKTLQVNGGDDISIGIGDSYTGEGIGSKRSAGGNQYWLDFYTNSTPQMSITRYGNVLARKQLFIGDASISDNANNGTIDIGFGGLNSGEGIGSKRTSGGNQYGLDFYTNNGTNRMIITNGGKVGIGITEPELMPGNYKLYVADGIMTEKVKVALKNTGDWADYVFADDYKLRDLKEVEAFVRENKHLPGVPSAEEVQKTGIDMASMDAKLLEKIEELTLYVISIQKENESLRKEIEAIKKDKN